MRDGHAAPLEDVYTVESSPTASQMLAGRTVEECALNDLAWGVCL
jgi:hypothetical protein